MRREGVPQIALIDRRGTQQQGVLRLETQFAGDQPRFAMDNGIVEQLGHAAVGQLIALRVLRMLPGDPVGERMREQVAEVVRRDIDG